MGQGPIGRFAPGSELARERKGCESLVYPPKDYTTLPQRQLNTCKWYHSSTSLWKCGRTHIPCAKNLSYLYVSSRVHIVAQRANRYIVAFHIAISWYRTIVGTFISPVTLDVGDLRAEPAGSAFNAHRTLPVVRSLGAGRALRSIVGAAHIRGTVTFMRAYKHGGGERVLATCHCEPRWVLDADYGCCWQATYDRFDGPLFSLRWALNGLTVVRPPLPPPRLRPGTALSPVGGGRAAVEAHAV